MISEATAIVTGVLATAASTVATALAGGEELTMGQPTRDAEAAGAGTSAVLAQFTGTHTGDLLIVIADEISAALQQSDLGPLDLASALAPTFEAVAAAIGPVVLGPLQVVDARLGASRVLANMDAAVVSLTGAAGPRAAVALALTSTQASTQATGRVIVTSMALDDVQSQRLDLLRGVEMEATVELGRARMTVNELLSLRTGAVVELDRAAGTPADLFVNGRLIARGEVVVVDENYGLRITQVVSDPQSR